MLVVYLGVLGQNDRFGLQRFSQLAKDVGTEIRYVRVAAEDLPSIQSAWAELAELAHTADAFIMPDDCVLYSEEYTSLLYQRIGAGSRLLVNINPNTLERQNAFLSRFDLTGTQVRIRSSTSHLIVLDRSAGAFRDFRLFGGVDQVQIPAECHMVWRGFPPRACSRRSIPHGERGDRSTKRVECTRTSMYCRLARGWLRRCLGGFG